MPHLKIETNLPKSKIPSDFLKQTVGIIAKTLGKPESYCVVTIVPDTMMSWGGSDDPCAIASLMSIGQLGVEPNKKHSKAIQEHVSKTLGISDTRMYIHFIDAAASDVGYQKTTFHKIFGGE